MRSRVRDPLPVTSKMRSSLRMIVGSPPEPEPTRTVAKSALVLISVTVSMVKTSVLTPATVNSGESPVRSISPPAHVPPPSTMKRAPSTSMRPPPPMFIGVKIREIVR